MDPVILDHLPSRLLECPAHRLHEHLAGPTLIHLPGRRPQPLFVSVLQHGNETSGWEAIRRLLLGRYGRDPLPRSLILMVGNVSAAAQHQRQLPGQMDLNRCWPGSPLPPGPWHGMLTTLTEHVKRRQPLASIDIHNNTGRNPHYAAVNRITPQGLELAALFCRTVIYFTEPQGVQSAAFSEFCPAVTLECGLSAEPGGADHAMVYLERVLHLDALPTQLPNPERLELFQMMATVRVADGLTFTFSDQPDATLPGLQLPADLDRLNFTEVAPGTCMALGHVDHPRPLSALGHDGQDLTEHCFQLKDGQVLTRQTMMPAMLTTNPQIVRSDCLCYLMERINLEALQRGLQRELDQTPLPEALDAASAAS